MADPDSSKIKSEANSKTNKSKNEAPENDPMQQEILRKMLKQLMKEKMWGNYFPFKYKDLLKILWLAKDIFEKESPLVEIAPPCAVVGDIHGQFQDLCRIFQSFSMDGKMGYASKKFTFLGDYVDRGKQSIECVILLFVIKILYPTKIMLLRGNHESQTINQVYGFKDEIFERFKDKKEALGLWLLFNDVFANLPLACLIHKTVLCMHGGISPHLNSLDDIKKIPKPLPEPQKSPLALDLMWADPMLGLKGFEPNNVRSVSVHFGEDVAIEKCEKLGIRSIIRAHQMMINGFNFFCNRLVLTIFSAADYFPAKANRGAVAIVNKDGHVGITMLIPSDKKSTGEKVFRGKHDEGTDEDFGGIHRKRN